MNSINKINEATEFLINKIGDEKPFLGIILGSGLGELANLIESPKIVPYTTIPGFPESTAIGHKGNFIFGKLGGKNVIAMQGRFHYYEGYPMDVVTLPVRVMILLGIKYLIVSNAAGGVNYNYKVGDLMIIKDHINLLPNPLIGKNLDKFGPRFPDMTRPYDINLIKLFEETAEKSNIQLRKGVYLAGSGPSYETPAEYNFFRLAGADAVGMSTVPEVIVARHSNIPVFGISVITNEAHDFADDFYNDGEDVIKAANEAAKILNKLIIEMVSKIKAN